MYSYVIERMSRCCLAHMTSLTRELPGGNHRCMGCGHRRGDDGEGPKSTRAHWPFWWPVELVNRQRARAAGRRMRGSS
jgi:hypothetical protein